MGNCALRALTVLATILLFAVSLRSAVGAPVGWSDDTRLTFNGRTDDPTIASLGGNIHLVWANDTAPYDLFYRRSEDYGYSWTEEKRLTNASASGLCNLPSIALNDTTIHVVYDDDRGTPYIETWYLRSEDNGDSWTEEVQLSEGNLSFSEWPDVACEGNNVYVVFGDQRDGEYEIYFKNSSDGGNTWSDDKRLTFHQTGTDDSPAIIATENPRADTDFTLRLETRGLEEGDRQFHVAGEGRFDGDAATLSLVGDSLLDARDPGRPYALDLKAEVVDTRIAVQGSLLRPLSLQGQNLEFTLEGPNPQRLSR
ncbi:MAG: exo-alpha-sialidase, partial [Thermoplasmata archaeon]